MKNTLKSFKIGSEFPPFIIAEMSGNHNQSLDHAYKIVDAAAEAGVSALKLQTYKPETITLNSDTKDFLIQDKSSLWDSSKLYDLYKRAQTPWDWHEKIFNRAKAKGLIVFSSPFDETSVDFLETLNVPFYKIASFENNHLPLIKKVAETGKPIIMSTGMASLAEIDEAFRTAKENGCPEIVLLKCTSNYPSSPKNSNLATIPHMSQLFKCEVGLSDHTLGIGVSIASIAMGASVIEKHLTLDRADGGVDSAFSLEPFEMKNLVEECNNAWLAKGRIFYGATPEEENSLKFRRSIYVSVNISKGEKVSDSNVRIVRPGFGIEPKFFNQIRGLSVVEDIKAGTPLKWEHFKSM